MRPAQESIDISRDLVSLLPRLRRFALTLTRNGANADTLVEAVCARATGRQTVWNGHGRLEDTLYTLARTLHDERTARRSPATEAHAAAETMAKSGFTDPVQRMIISMPSGLASVFLLVAVEHHSYRETAHILGLSPDAVAGKLAMARRQLAAMASDISERRA